MRRLQRRYDRADEQGSDGGVQRWRDRHPDHDHGSRAPRPEGTDLAALGPLGPIFLSYVLSFALLGTYWNNHHHLLQAAKVVDGRVLWANLHLLFWLSLFPSRRAGWVRACSRPSRRPSTGVVSLMVAIAFYVLVHALVRCPGQAPTLAAAIGSDRKGRLSPLLYALAIPIALVAPPIALALFATVVCIWIVAGSPDRTGPDGLTVCPASGRPAARSTRPIGRVQAHRTGHALERDRADLPERNGNTGGGVDHLLADDHLAGPREAPRSRGDV